ncbi:MAG TPA: UvrD-helicase domain-containing protein [Chthonomonadaceae bacterium]|nr:UvrD-helicase domain-containing protein [Chthonomonadaceae bacterium]
MTHAFTPNQKQAIETADHDLCVAAGAGSGKTGVLVERFVRLVAQRQSAAIPPEQRVNVEDILVITFTEKATKEMKARIVAELNRLGMIQERRQVETAYISTIHGFCSRLLQENPFEAGVDPKFGVLDETQARRLLRQVTEKTIAHSYAQRMTGSKGLFQEGESGKQFGEEGRDIQAAVTIALGQTLQRMRGAGVRVTDLEAHWQQGPEAMAQWADGPVWMILEPILAEIAACALSLEALRIGIMGTLEIACQAIRESASRLIPRQTSVVDTLSTLEETYKSLSRARARQMNAPPQEIRIAQLLARVKVASEEARGLFGALASREERACQVTYEYWGLLIAVWKAYTAEKRRLGKLDSDDLQAEGVRLLEEAPGVRERYRRRFRHIMVDEFQDTNPMQMRLIELLRVKEADHPRRNYLFVVGDVQQSIYAFRNADPTLFRDLERRFREGSEGQHVQLADNFRSRDEILRVIEQIFQQVWRDARTPFVPLRCGAAFEPRETPSLEVLLTQDIPRRDYVRLEADALAVRIQHMVEGGEMRLTGQRESRYGQPVRYGDIAILLRSLTDIQKYEEAFARRGVPYYIVGGGRGYYARPEIRDLLNLLTVLETPLDDVALAATLRSPMVGIDIETLYRLKQQARQSRNARPKAIRQRSADQDPLYPAIAALLATETLPSAEAEKLTSFLQTMETLRAQEDRMPVGHLLERLIVHTQYDVRLLCRPGGRRRLANVRKLLQMANADSVIGTREFIRRLRTLERLSEREGDAPTEEEAADVVRFLTIHSAKGLEFPVVVVADLSRGLLVPEKGLFVCDPQHYALGTRLGGEPNTVYKAIVKRKETAEREESSRLLYVAMTRAREYLILCGNVGRNAGYNWADNLFSVLGITNAPAQPEIQTLIGSITAQVAPLAHYVHTPLVKAPGAHLASRRHAEEEADQMARAILEVTPQRMPTEDT